MKTPIDNLFKRFVESFLNRGIGYTVLKIAFRLWCIDNLEHLIILEHKHLK